MVVSNERGEFEMAYGKQAVEMILRVSPRGMAQKLFTEPTGADRKTMTVTDGASIFGRVLQPDGKPAANVELGVMEHSRISGICVGGDGDRDSRGRHVCDYQCSR